MGPDIRRLPSIYREEGLGGVVTQVRRYTTDTRWLRTELSKLTRARERQKVRAWKEARTEAEKRYTHNPSLSFIVHAFNRRRNVDHQAEYLPMGPDRERIICDDGSVDGTHKAWVEHLTRRNDYLVRTNDLHDVRVYTRAIQLSRADVVCLLQDDDKFPDHDRWVEHAMEFFDAYPDLAMLGAYSPIGLENYDEDGDWSLFADRDIPPPKPWIVEDGEPFPTVDGEPLGFVDPRTGRPLVFVVGLGLSPIFIRTDVFEEIGGFDLEFAPPGLSGAQFFPDFGIRCWKAGYKVAFFSRPDMRFQEFSAGGLTLYQKDIHVGQEHGNRSLILEKHRADFADVITAIRGANEDIELLDDPDNAEIPF